ncbi:unnamed protein product [Symbiodinium natans]|uniref:C3H1-type domain-containing protein n=1 Tax=Symbiodinium natans TaxID=878477 RepID=A0A812HZ51_9DINO|nr:unnamed protein product [Symbiodinium natans]
MALMAGQPITAAARHASAALLTEPMYIEPVAACPWSLAAFGGPDDLPMAANPGSLGHPEVCRRPCIYFSVSGCTNGDECGYCHMPHMQRPVHLDKRQRELLQTLNTGELMAILLQHLRTKAEEKGFLPLAADVLAILERHAVAPTARVPVKVQSKLDALLNKMTFAALIGMALRRKDVNPGFVQEMNEALSGLRLLWAEA